MHIKMYPLDQVTESLIVNCFEEGSAASNFAYEQLFTCLLYTSLKPMGFEAGKKYPGIFDIHGGPKTVYGPVFYHEMQYWACLLYTSLWNVLRNGEHMGRKAIVRYGTLHTKQSNRGKRKERCV